MRPVGGVVTAGVGSAGMPGLFGLLLAAGALAAARLRTQTRVAPP